MLGTDDYVTKPFVTGELVARLGAVMRRSRPQLNAIALGEVTVDFATRSARRGFVPLELFHREFAILQYLARRPNTVVSRR